MTGLPRPFDRELDLFQTVENRAALKSLEERRNALLKSLQNARPGSHRRWKIEARLCDVTTELMRRQLLDQAGGHRDLRG